MKIIWPNNITAVTASSEESNYAAEMVLNNWPGAVWKAGATTAQTLTVTVAAPEAVHLGYTNFGGTLTYTTKDSVGATIATGTLTPCMDQQGKYHFWLDISPSGGGDVSVWDTGAWDTGAWDTGVWDTSGGSGSAIASIVFGFGAVSTAVTVGVVRAGVVTDLGHPNYGMGDGLEDYSVEAELNSGGIYTIDRGVARVVAGEILTTRNANGTDPLVSLAASIKAGAFSVMVIDDPEELLLARFPKDGRPEASRDYPLYNTVSFALREAI